MSKQSTKHLTHESIQPASKPGPNFYGLYHDYDEFKFEPGGRSNPHQRETFEFEPHYYAARTEQKFEFEPQMVVDNIDGEIALCRLHVASLWQHDPYNTTAFMQAVWNVCKLVKLRHEMKKYDDEASPGKSSGDILEEVAASMGITIRYKDIQAKGGSDDDGKADPG